MPKQQKTYELQPDHVAWLEEMAKKHHLSNDSKALRCLIDFAMEDGDEKEIFEKIRCRHC